MELNEYQVQAMRTCLPECRNWTYGAGLLHEEAGELQGKVDKAVRLGLAKIDNNQLRLTGTQMENDLLREAMKKELGDVMWAVADIAEVMGWTLEEVCRMNIDKLADRQRRNKIAGEGDNR